jgi:hypothetical protein
MGPVEMFLAPGPEPFYLHNLHFPCLELSPTCLSGEHDYFISDISEKGPRD